MKIISLLFISLLISCGDDLGDDTSTKEVKKTVKISKVMSMNQHCLKGCNFYFDILRTSKKLNKDSISLTMDQLNGIQNNCLNSCVYKVIGEQKEELVETISEKEESTIDTSKKVNKKEENLFEDEDLVPFEQRGK